MKTRVNTITGKVLSAGEDKYPEDIADIIAIDIDALPHDDLRFCFYNGSIVVLKDQAAIDAIVASDTEIESRPSVAVAAIKTQVLALLNETDADTLSRVDALTAAQVKNEVGKIEVLIKHLVPLIKRGMKEDVQ